MAQVQVADALGRKVWIPEHWMDHPVLSRGFRKLRSGETPTPAEVSATPDENWTHAQLDQYAADRQVDLSGTTTKAEKIAAINTSTEA